jgi:phage recombination protein Bet
MVRNLICVPTKLGARCDQNQAIKFIMLCKARALNPWEGDAYLVGYDTKDGPQFSLITAHQAFLKRAEVHPEYDGMESGVIVADAEGNLAEREGDFFIDGETVLGGWARVHFKDRKFPMYKRLRLSTFNKGFGRWRDDPAGQIVKCAEADALRSSFPTSLGGMYLEGEMDAVVAEEPEKVKTLPPERGRHYVRPAGHNGAAPGQSDSDALAELSPEPAAPTTAEPKADQGDAYEGETK